MPSQLLVENGTQLSFADHAGDFAVPAADSLERGTPTDVQMQTASVAAAAGVQSAKVDLGTPWPPEYKFSGVFEVASGAAVSGEVIDFYWAPSNSSTAANGNPGGVSGADGAYTGTGADSLADSVRQLVYIGSHVCTTDDTADTPNIQTGEIGILRPTAQYGTLVMVNNMTGAMHSDDVETHIVADPLIPESQ